MSLAIGNSVGRLLLPLLYRGGGSAVAVSRSRRVELLRVDRVAGGVGRITQLVVPRVAAVVRLDLAGCLRLFVLFGELCGMFAHGFLTSIIMIVII